MIVPWFIVSGNIHDTQSGVGVCRNHELVRTRNLISDTFSFIAGVKHMMENSSLYQALC